MSDENNHNTNLFATNPVVDIGGPENVASMQKEKPTAQIYIKPMFETDDQRIEHVLHAIRETGFNLGEFLFYVFQPRKQREKGRSRSVAAVVSKFLRGVSRKAVKDILQLWMEHTDGTPKQASPDAVLMYSREEPWTSIKFARLALTSFAVQTTREKMVNEVNAVTNVASGLHVATPKRNGKPARRLVTWENIGPKLLSEITDIYKRYQPVTWDILMHMAAPETHLFECGFLSVNLAMF